jgi:hypothetical protein
MGSDHVPQGGVPCSEVCGAMSVFGAIGDGSGNLDVGTLSTGGADLGRGGPNHVKGSAGGAPNGGGPDIDDPRGGGDCGNKFSATGGGVTESCAVFAPPFLHGSPPTCGGPFSNKCVQTEPTFPRTTTTPNSGSIWGHASGKGGSSLAGGRVDELLGADFGNLSSSDGTGSSVGPRPRWGRQARWHQRGRPGHRPGRPQRGRSQRRGGLG